MAKPIKKKLFGKIPVTLEPVTGEDKQYELVKGNTPQEVTKNDIKDGLVKALKIIPSYWDTLPKSELGLSSLELNETKPLTTVVLDFKTSPFFGKYWKVMNSFQANLKTETKKDILK